VLVLFYSHVLAFREHFALGGCTVLGASDVPKLNIQVHHFVSDINIHCLTFALHYV